MPLYRLLTGEYPFASIADIQVWVEPTNVHKLNPQIPLSLLNVVRKTLARAIPLIGMQMLAG